MLSNFDIFLSFLKRLLADRTKFPVETPFFNRPNDWNDECDCAVIVRGDVFFIDKEWMEFVCSRRFYVNPSGYMQYGEKGKKIVFHRTVMDAPQFLIVDHINRNRNDNRKRNLRIANQSQNQANKIGKNLGDGRGVKKARNKWQASIGFNSERIYIGLFETKEKACIAYDKKAVELFGEFAVTNYPIENYEIPENPKSNEIPLTIPKKADKRECKWEGCQKNIVAESEYCYRHDRITKKNLDRFGKIKINIRSEIKSDFCIRNEHGENKVKVFTRNLCALHYRQQRREEGYKKPPKKKQKCSIGECTSLVVKQGLCTFHWKDKMGLSHKITGRPKADLVPCKICGEMVRSRISLCKKHYIEQWRTNVKK